MQQQLNPDTCQHNWQALTDIKARIPADYLPWVTLPGSLTQALRDRSDAFSVQVLEQHYVSVSLAIPGFENPDGAERCFSRKVLLMHNATPWVAAHTLVPEKSLQNGLDALTQLENKPLGELLFSTQGVRKDHLQACQTPFGWGRRARYVLQQQPLLVSEFFLPALMNYERNRLIALH